MRCCESWTRTQSFSIWDARAAVFLLGMPAVPSCVSILERWPDSPAPNVLRLQADAAQLPLRSRSVDFTVCNHSLEHVANLPGCLSEIGRTLKESSALFISVPDVTTLTDRIYRWLGRGGGHVIGFDEPLALARLISAGTGLDHRATWTLHSSLSFLNRRNISGRPQLKLLLFGGGHELVLAVFVAFLRLIDSVFPTFPTRLTVYGWAMYFGDARLDALVNDIPQRRYVCVRCGSGYSRSELGSRLRWCGVIYLWHCPFCSGRNLLFPPLAD